MQWASGLGRKTITTIAKKLQFSCGLFDKAFKQIKEKEQNYFMYKVLSFSGQTKIYPSAIDINKKSSVIGKFGQTFICNPLSPGKRNFLNF